MTPYLAYPERRWGVQGVMGTWARWPGEGAPAGASGVRGRPLVTPQAETSKVVGGLPLRLNEHFPPVRETQGPGREQLSAASCRRPCPHRDRCPTWAGVSSRARPLCHAQTHPCSSGHRPAHRHARTTVRAEMGGGGRPRRETARAKARNAHSGSTRTELAGERDPVGL